MFRSEGTAQDDDVNEPEHDDDTPDLEGVGESAGDGEPHGVPPEGNDDLSSEDPWRDHSPRSVAEMFGVSPPLSSDSERSEESAQPDEELDDREVSDAETVPRGRNGNFREAASGKQECLHFAK